MGGGGDVDDPVVYRGGPAPFHPGEAVVPEGFLGPLGFPPGEEIHDFGRQGGGLVGGVSPAVRLFDFILQVGIPHDEGFAVHHIPGVFVQALFIQLIVEHAHHVAGTGVGVKGDFRYLPALGGQFFHGFHNLRVGVVVRILEILLLLVDAVGDVIDDKVDVGDCHHFQLPADDPFIPAAVIAPDRFGPEMGLPHGTDVAVVGFWIGQQLETVGHGQDLGIVVDAHGQLRFPVAFGRRGEYAHLLAAFLRRHGGEGAAQVIHAHDIIGVIPVLGGVGRINGMADDRLVGAVAGGFGGGFRPGCAAGRVGAGRAAGGAALPGGIGGAALLGRGGHGVGSGFLRGEYGIVVHREPGRLPGQHTEHHRDHDAQRQRHAADADIQLIFHNEIAKPGEHSQTSLFRYSRAASGERAVNQERFRRAVRTIAPHAAVRTATAATGAATPVTGISSVLLSPPLSSGVEAGSLLEESLLVSSPV